MKWNGMVRWKSISNLPIGIDTITKQIPIMKMLFYMWYGKNDQPIQHPDGSKIPTIELKDRVDYDLIEKISKATKFSRRNSLCRTLE